MNGEVIDSLFGLLDERIAINFPGQFFRFSTDFLEGLINGHGTDGNGRVPKDRFTGFVNILPVERSMTVSAPQRVAQTHFFDFLFDARSNGAVADIGIDLHQKIAADNHRLASG